MIIQLVQPTSRRAPTLLPPIPPLSPSDIDEPVITLSNGYISQQSDFGLLIDLDFHLVTCLDDTGHIHDADKPAAGRNHAVAVSDSPERVTCFATMRSPISAHGGLYSSTSNTTPEGNNSLVPFGSRENSGMPSTHRLASTVSGVSDSVIAKRSAI